MDRKTLYLIPSSFRMEVSYSVFKVALKYLKMFVSRSLIFSETNSKIVNQRSRLNGALSNPHQAINAPSNTLFPL